MSGNTYTEEEFKQVLKSLFTEKKRVKDLEKQIEQKGVDLPSKFQAKLADFHKISIAQEYAQLQTTHETQQKQLEKIKPVLQKLAAELKEANAKIEDLKAQPLRIELEKAQEKIAALEQENDTSAEVLALEEQLERLTKEKEEFEERSEKAEETLAKEQEEKQKETQRFETERQRLVERLADELSQIQRQSEVIKDLREEAGRVSRRFEESEEQLTNLKEKLSQSTLEQTQLHSSVERQLDEERRARTALEGELAKQSSLYETELAKHSSLLETELAKQSSLYEAELAKQATLLEAEQEHLRKQSEQCQLLQEEGEALKAQLEETQAGENAETTLQLEELKQKLAEQTHAHETVLQESYTKMKEISERNCTLCDELANLQEQLGHFHKVDGELKHHVEERDIEIRKAQQHLAKKVKENTILRDLIERQKVQIIELQNTLTTQKSELDRMQNNLNLQRMHEEKLQTMAKERALAAEGLAKEWQEKYFTLHQEWQEAKGEVIEFHKMKKSYDQMSSAFSNMKNFLGNVPSSEKENDAS